MEVGMFQGIQNKNSIIREGMKVGKGKQDLGLQCQTSVIIKVVVKSI